MIAAVMIYATEVSALLGIAAWAIERVAIWRGLSRRLGWAVAMTVSVVLPVVGVMTPPKAPPLIVTTQNVTFTQQTEPGAAAPAAAAAKAPARAVIPPQVQHTHRPVLQTSVTLGKSLAAIWLVGSCGLLAAYMILTLRLRLAARNWRRQQV